MVIDDDDSELFRSSVGSVHRIQHNRDRSRPRPPGPKPKQLERDEAEVMAALAYEPIDFAAVESGEELSHVKPGIRKNVVSRLRRGQWRVQEEVDLHEMTVEVAHQTIKAFLNEAIREGLTCVKIIHGKGLRSGPEGPKLKRLTAGVLARHSQVLAFASAPPHDGGTGAVYVLLKP